ncbi:hypothetical protein [Rhodoferax antarcticus]|uniref:hypothetical protein n=1 Tax=Rhodoferax antarcticus TaxID=81479 RepID=UPI00222467AF|nr:hypothetical protein [Rhodoferax antarcticus]MCW2310568.1 hypothetical protein [Rhodoferax antarcticus]
MRKKSNLCLLCMGLSKQTAPLISQEAIFFRCARWVCVKTRQRCRFGSDNALNSGATGAYSERARGHFGSYSSKYADPVSPLSVAKLTL